MAMFKIRRSLRAMKDATFTGGITASSTLDVTGAVAVTGGLTTASAFSVGSGTTLKKIIAGSLDLTCPSLAASTAGTVAGCIPGLGSAGSTYKVFPVQVSTTGTCVVLTGIAASATSPEGKYTFTFFNAGGADDAATATVRINYLAVLDA